MIDRLPHELVTQIFCLIAQQKVDRKSFRNYEDGCHLVPFLQPSSRVCKQWRNFLLENRTRCMRALTLRFRKQWLLLQTEHIQHAQHMIDKHSHCPILVILDVCDGTIEPSKLVALLLHVLNATNLSDRLQAIDMVFYSTLNRHLLNAFADRMFSNLEYIGLDIHHNFYSHNWEPEDIALESATVLSGSMFPRIAMNDDPGPNLGYLDLPEAQLVFSGLKNLTGIRILNCFVLPNWANLCYILMHNPELQNLAIQVANTVLTLVPDVIGIADISLSCLTKCFMQADARTIWQFLSIQGISRLKYLSLSFASLPRYESMPVPVLKADLSQLVYLSLQPLCSVTANFLAEATMHSLVTLNFIPEGGNARNFYHSEDTWPRSISLPALTTLRVAGTKLEYSTLLLRALAKGAESMQASESPHPLRSLTLDLTQWNTDDESDMLHDVFLEPIFRNVTSLSIEQTVTVVSSHFLVKIMSHMPSLSHLYLSQAWECNWTLVLPLVYDSETETPDVLLTRMNVLEINTCHSHRDTRHDNLKYLTSSDEVDLLQLLKGRSDHDHVDGICLNTLRLRINPRLREEIKEKIHHMKCSVEDNVDFSYRLSAAQEFEEL